MSWQKQEDVYLIMWRSKISGATLSELRRTELGKEKFVRTLEIMGGYSQKDIVVIKQKKQWKPEKIGGFKKAEEVEGGVKE